MSTRLRRTFAAATATGLLLAGLTACGDSETAADNAPAGVAAVPDEGETVDPADFAEDLKAGLERSTTARMTMTVESAALTMEAEGQIDYSADPVAMTMTMNSAMMSDQPIEMRMVDNVLYLSMGRMTNDKFVALDLSDPENLPPGMDALTGQLDPLSAFQDLGDALDEVTYVGTEQVAGEELAHYRLALDPTKVDSMKDLPTGAGTPETVEYDLLVDDEFRMRRMTMALDVGMSVEIDARLSEWGEPVQIEVPSQDQISDAPMGGVTLG